ncbi:unnamed protein product [Boreogadus saida]
MACMWLRRSDETEFRCFHLTATAATLRGEIIKTPRCTMKDSFPAGSRRSRGTEGKSVATEQGCPECQGPGIQPGEHIGPPLAETIGRTDRGGRTETDGLRRQGDIDRTARARRTHGEDRTDSGGQTGGQIKMRTKRTDPIGQTEEDRPMRTDGQDRQEDKQEDRQRRTDR